MPDTPPDTKPRPIGLGKGLAEIPDSFFAPLPDDLLDLFEGKANRGPSEQARPR